MKLRFKLFIFTLLSILILASTGTFAAVGDTPPANAEIGNQATLEYFTGAGEHRTVVSNIVVTVINPVYGVDIDPPIHLTGKGGELIRYVHTLTNIGNVADRYTITVEDLTDKYIDLGSGRKYRIKTYVDGALVNRPDGNIPEIPAGGTASVIVEVKGDGNLTGTLDEFKVVATSKGAAEATPSREVKDWVKDNLTLTEKAVVDAFKQFSDGYKADNKTTNNIVDRGDTEVPFMATFFFNNTGGQAAGRVKIDDLLNDNFELVDITPTYVLNDAEAIDLPFGSTKEGITINQLDAGRTVEILIDDGVLAVGPSEANGLEELPIKVSFWIQAKATAPAGNIPNRGSLSYEDDVTLTNYNKFGNTNTVRYRVRSKPGIIFEGEDIGKVEQGSLILFRNYIKNTGNTEDTFDITYRDNEFPAGTDFFLSHYMGDMTGIDENNLPEITLDDFDQRIPLIDTNGDEAGLVDTGILKPDQAEIILLWVQLPLEAIGNNIKVDKLGISTEDPQVEDTARDICDITPVKVDITNNRYLGMGEDDRQIGKGQGPEVAPVTELSINPGETGYFSLYVNNTAEFLTDSYLLDVSTDSTFATLVQPEGIKVTLETPQGAQITTTEDIEPGGHENIRAKVEVEGDALAGNHMIYFRVRSPQTGAEDIKTDMIKIGIVRNLTITPTNKGEIYAGQNIVYSHTIKNGGNVVEGGGTTSSQVLVEINESRSNHFSSTCYWDADGNGVLEKGFDPQLKDLAMEGIEGLAPGESIPVFVEVHAAKTATTEMVCTSTIRLNVDRGVYTVNHPNVSTTDVTTIIEDKIVIEKYQGYDTATGTGPANPGDFTKDEQTGDTTGYIYYKIVAKNTGTTPISNVAIEDAVPQYTTMVYAPQNTFLAEHFGKPSWRYSHEDVTEMKLADKVPAVGERGLIEVDIPELAPNGIVELYFAVKIDGIAQEDIKPENSGPNEEDDPDKSPDNPSQP